MLVYSLSVTVPQKSKHQEISDDISGEIKKKKKSTNTNRGSCGEGDRTE